MCAIWHFVIYYLAQVLSGQFIIGCEWSIWNFGEIVDFENVGNARSNGTLCSNLVKIKSMILYKG